ncbi:hypothetical protein SEPCBS57363_000954 [Sporothrix epigloea]|uniref:RING-type domain-containing protein n=1 Tax=Sporothrix epigloea TaxID=1892477 RepID=A0ABP0D8M8_9PEZI
MASASTAPQSLLASREGYDVAFCHSCLHEWYLNQGSILPPPCPSCRGEIIEIVIPENDPREYNHDGNSVFSQLLRDITSHMAFDQRSHDVHASGHYSHDEDEDLDDFGGHGEDEDYASGHDEVASPTNRDDRNHWHDPFSSNQVGHHRDDPQPEDDMDYSDPEMADIDEEEFQGPNNPYAYRSGASLHPPSQGSGGDAGAPGHGFQGLPPLQYRPRPSTPPLVQRAILRPANREMLLGTFRQFMAGLGGPNQVGHSGPESLFAGSGPGSPGNARNNERSQSGSPRNSPGPTAAQNGSQPQRPGYTSTRGTTSHAAAPRPLQTEGTAGRSPVDFGAVFSSIMGNVGPPNAGGQTPRAPGGHRAGSSDFPPAARSIQQLFTALMNGPSYDPADVVHSDGALDQAVSMLLDANEPDRGPPPATEATLKDLKRTAVDAQMLEPDGCAECTICICELVLNDMVLHLPCKHWFHEECGLTWLRQHNTCPVCRKAVTSDRPDPANVTDSAGNQDASRPGDDDVPSGGLFDIGMHIQAMDDHMRALHERSMDHTNWRHQSNPDRLNAIRAAGNRPPEPAMPSTGFSRASPFAVFASASTSTPRPEPGAAPSNLRTGTTAAAAPRQNSSFYRSSRVSDESAAGNERQRRDSHSPVLGPGGTRNRFNATNGNPSSSPLQRSREQRY